MSRSNETRLFIKDENGWADFFITRVGLIIFASVLLLSAFKVYPIFQERETKAYLETVASDIASKIEAVDSTAIPWKYTYVFNEKNNNINIAISTEYVVARANLSAGGGLTHAEPVLTHVAPPNSKWNNTSELREYLGKELGRDGNISNPINFTDRGKVDDMFDHIKGELAKTPFIPQLNKSLIIEKVIIYYTNKTELIKRDYVLIYQ